ncbi:unnamed protein product [Closterium sp. NIES-53]
MSGVDYIEDEKRRKTLARKVSAKYAKLLTRRRTAALPCPARCRAACPKQRAVALPSTPGRLLLAPPACCPHAALAARTQLAHCSRGPHAARTSPVLPCAARAVCSLLARRPLPAALCRPPPAALRAALPALPACALPERPTHCPATPAHAPALPLLHCLHRQLAPCPALLARLLLLLAPPAHTPAGTASELPNRAAQSSRPFEPPCRAALLSRSFLAAAGGFAVGGVGVLVVALHVLELQVLQVLALEVLLLRVLLRVVLARVDRSLSRRSGFESGLSSGAALVAELDVLELEPSALRHLLSLPPAATEFPVAGTTPLLLFPPTDQSQPQLLPGSPLPAPAPQTKVTESLTECCEPETRASTLVHARRVARPCAPAVQGTHRITLRPSSVPQRVVLPSPPASSLSYGPDPKSDLVCTASPTVTCLLAMVVTDPSFESAAASALVAEHVDFAALCRLDYVASLGYSFSLGAGSVSWRPTRSSFVLSSSCEAEIYAGAMGAQELRWLTYLLTHLGERPRSPPVLYVVNKAMIAFCQDQRLEHRTKRIALCYFLTRELQ